MSFNIFTRSRIKTKTPPKFRRGTPPPPPSVAPQKNNISVAYLCDGQAKCKGGIMCGKECKHTEDIKHAKNFKKIDETHYMEISKQRGKRHNGNT